MKTAIQHFHSLPQPYGQMAIEETIRQGSKSELNDPFESASAAVEILFTWSISKMEFYFWWGIYDNLQHLESQSKQDKG